MSTVGTLKDAQKEERLAKMKRALYILMDKEEVRWDSD
jgi:hypothetical protein